MSTFLYFWLRLFSLPLLQCYTIKTSNVCTPVQTLLKGGETNDGCHYSHSGVCTSHISFINSKKIIFFHSSRPRGNYFFVDLIVNTMIFIINSMDYLQYLHTNILQEVGFLPCHCLFCKMS